jgi:dTDP-4-dehydrorhamnose reductase
MKVLVLGATGMLGSAVLSLLDQSGHEVLGAVRSGGSEQLFPSRLAARLVVCGDLEQDEMLVRLLEKARPDWVINCTSVARALHRDVDRMLGVYAVLPQRLAHACRLAGARLLQVSSDGVFAGTRGHYGEDDQPDAGDLYGRAKRLGEIRDPHAVTIRTSMVGHELASRAGLLEWFLGQEGRCRCYTRAIFCGLPTFVLAAVMRDYILPRADLSGVYHVGGPAISKFDLLTLVARQYGKHIAIEPDDSVALDRSLIVERFFDATGFRSPDWPELVRVMHSHQFDLARA